MGTRKHNDRQLRSQWYHTNISAIASGLIIPRSCQGSPVAIATFSVWNPQKPIILCSLYIYACDSFSRTHSTHTARNATLLLCGWASLLPLNFYWEKKKDFLYLENQQVKCFHTNNIVHIKKKTQRNNYCSIAAFSTSHSVSFPARGPLTCSCAWSRVRWRAWGRRKTLRLQSWKTSALAACTSGKEMREQWRKKDKRTSSFHWVVRARVECLQ